MEEKLMTQNTEEIKVNEEQPKGDILIKPEESKTAKTVKKWGKRILIGAGVAGVGLVGYFLGKGKHNQDSDDILVMYSDEDYECSEGEDA